MTPSERSASDKPDSPARQCSEPRLRARRTAHAVPVREADRGQLEWLCREGHVELIEPGRVFAEGDPATCFYVLIEGTVVLSRRVGADDVEISRTSQRGVYAGAFPAYLGDRVPQVYPNSLRVTEPSRFFVLDAESFAQIMDEWFPMAVHLLEGLFFGSSDPAGDRPARAAAGPRLAVGRADPRAQQPGRGGRAGHRRRCASGSPACAASWRMLAGGKCEPADLETLVELQERGGRAGRQGARADPDGGVRREDGLTDWLDDHGIADGWRLAPTFVQAGLDATWLEQVADDGRRPGMLEGALRWLNYTVETELLMNEIEDSTTRVSTLVGAAKQYSQLDRAPFQVVDVHDLLDSTLLMLSAKTRHGITVVKEYDRTLPRIPAYAAELNQVWTNLIDNAVAGDGRRGHADRPHRPGRTTACWSRSATPAPASRDDIQEPHLRAVLHHQAGRRGHRARAGHLLADRGQQAPRRPAGRVGARRHPVPGAAAAGSNRTTRRELMTDQIPASTPRSPPSGTGCVECEARAAGGCTCAAAPSAATSAAATPHRRSTPPRTRRRPDTRSSAASSRARTGSGPTRPRRSTRPARPRRPGAPPARTSRCPARAAASRATGGRSSTDDRGGTAMSVITRGFTGRGGATQAAARPVP